MRRMLPINTIVAIAVAHGALALTMPRPASADERPSSLPLTAGPARLAPADATPQSTQSPDAADAQISDLIRQLGDDWFPERERAQRELIELGYGAYDGLIEAENHADPEVAGQARYLLRLLRASWVREHDPLEVRALLSEYEGRGVSLRLRRIQDLAELPDDAGLEALSRLVKYETSELVSKTAALAILAKETGSKSPERRAERRETLERLFARSPRRGAAWVNAHLQMQSDPAVALPKWSAFVAQEERLQSDFSELTHPRIIADLLRIEVAMLDELDRGDDAEARLGKMLEMDLSDSELLVDTIRYLAERQAWNLLDRLEQRAADALATDALALYQLAESRQQQGDEPRSLAAAERAVKVSARRTTDHVQMAGALLDKGLFRWADYEFNYVLEHDKAGTVASLWAAMRYSELLHDRGLHRQAGEVRKRIVDAVENDPDRPTLQALSQLESTVEEFRSRMHYFFACHYAAENDPARRLAELKQGIEVNPTDEDVLIALFHLPNQPETDLQATRELIRQAVEKNRELIRKEPEESMGYNQLAWLVANTEGDFGEAVSLAQRAIQLRREEAARLGVPARVGGYYDTLAHCYAAQKDYASAVKTQLEAIRLDPHSRQIADKLAHFKRQLAEQQGAATPPAGS